MCSASAVFPSAGLVIVSVSVSPSVTLCPDCVCAVARESWGPGITIAEISVINGIINITDTHTVSLHPGPPAWAPVSEGLLSLAIISSSRLITGPGPCAPGALANGVWPGQGSLDSRGPVTTMLHTTTSLTHQPIKDPCSEQIICMYVDVFHDSEELRHNLFVLHWVVNNALI